MHRVGWVVALACLSCSKVSVPARGSGSSTSAKSAERKAPARAKAPAKVGAPARAKAVKVKAPASRVTSAQWFTDAFKKPAAPKCVKRKPGRAWQPLDKKKTRWLQVSEGKVALAPFAAGKRRVPQATLWRRQQSGCWTSRPVFYRPPGNAAVTLSTRRGATVVARRQLKLAGKQIEARLALSKDEDKPAKLTLLLDGKLLLEDDFRASTFDAVLKFPDNTKARTSTCFAARGHRLSVDLVVASDALYLLWRCVATEDREWSLVRIDPATRKATWLHDGMIVGLNAAEGCGSCEYELEGLVMRTDASKSLRLHYREERLRGTGATTCEPHCYDTCEGTKGKRKMKACVAVCRKKAAAEAARDHRACRTTKKTLARWARLDDAYNEVALKPLGAKPRR